MKKVISALVCVVLCGALMLCGCRRQNAPLDTEPRESQSSSPTASEGWTKDY